MFLMAALAAFSLSACAVLTEGNADAKLIVQYSVIKVAENDKAKAARIAEIATEVKKYSGGETLITVELLVEAIRNEIRWDELDAADALLVNALLERLRSELVERLGDGVLPEDLRLAVDVLAGWIIEATLLV
jgi:hypothetical protein